MIFVMITPQYDPIECFSETVDNPIIISLDFKDFRREIVIDIRFS